MLSKKIKIISCAVFSVFFLTWITFFIMFPAAVIDNVSYNTNKLKKLNKQRESAYNELYSSFQNELNKIIDIKYVKTVFYKNYYEKEKLIIYNGEISFFDIINEYNLLYMTKEELRILRNTIFAKYGYIFQSNDLAEHFNKFSWYDPQYNNVEEKLTKKDIYLINIIREIESGQLGIDMQSVLKIFYNKSLFIDKTYFDLMNECNSKIKFPMQNISRPLIQEVFPSYINAVKHNNLYYNEFALKLLMDRYENIVVSIIEEKTNNFLEYIDYCLYNSIIIDFDNYYTEFNENILDNILSQCLIENDIIEKINISNAGISDALYPDISVRELDGFYYSLAAVNKLQNSMEIISAYLLKNIKDILINGVYFQTEVYSNNIDDYIRWYYSFFTSIERRITSAIGFLTQEKSTEEKYFTDNFNRIMNKNANFDQIIKDDMYIVMGIIEELFNEYFYTLEYFKIHKKKKNENTMTKKMFISPLINSIVIYFEHVFEALENSNYYIYQDYKIRNDIVTGVVANTTKLISNFDLLAGLAVDYLNLQLQRAVNDSALRQQLLNRMIENQNNKIDIIKDPYNYLYDKLVPGSILFVDNYLTVLEYQHYGVYIGNGKVIHFAPLEGQDISFENGIIHEAELEVFLKGRALQIEKNVKNAFSEQEIIQRARSRLGEKGYNLITNNCEHFARWCVTGESISYQVLNSPQYIYDTVLVISDGFKTISDFIQLFY